MQKTRSQDDSWLLGVIVGGAVASLFALGIIAILSGLFNSSSTSKGRLLAKKERYLMEKTEYYEGEVEHQSAELLKAEIFEPKRSVEIYGRKKE